MSTRTPDTRADIVNSKTCHYATYNYAIFHFIMVRFGASRTYGFRQFTVVFFNVRPTLSQLALEKDWS